MKPQVAMRAKISFRKKISFLYHWEFQAPTLALSACPRLLLLPPPPTSNQSLWRPRRRQRAHTCTAPPRGRRRTRTSTGEKSRKIAILCAFKVLFSFLRLPKTLSVDSYDVLIVPQVASEKKDTKNIVRVIFFSRPAATTSPERPPSTWWHCRAATRSSCTQSIFNFLSCGNIT